MARKARKISQTGYYLVYADYNNLNLVNCDDDFLLAKDCIQKASEKQNCDILAYSFSNSFLSLVLFEEKSGNISSFMQNFLSVLSQKYNTIYKRTGSIIRDRFTSIPIDDTELVNDIIFYIHSFANNINYTSHKKILDFTYIPSIYIKKHKKTKQEINKIIHSLSGKKASEFSTLSKEVRDSLLIKLRKEHGLTISEIKSVTGLSKNTITGYVKKEKNKKDDEIWLL